MSFAYDATGLDPDQSYPLLPEGKWFPFRIFETEEKESKSGNPMVVCKCRPFNVPAEYREFEVWHYVTFMPPDQKGASLNVHFRKCIGVAWEGNVDVEADDWVGQTFMGKIGHEFYNGKKNHKIVEISPMPKGQETEQPEPPAAAVASKKDKDIPF